MGRGGEGGLPRSNSLTISVDVGKAYHLPCILTTCEPEIAALMTVMSTDGPPISVDLVSMVVHCGEATAMLFLGQSYLSIPHQ